MKPSQPIRHSHSHKPMSGYRVPFTPSTITLALGLLLVSITGCASSSKSLQKGRYDEAIERSVKKLNRKPADAQELNVLKEAFVKANELDQRRVDLLLLEQREEGWEELLVLYRRMDRRQDAIRRGPLSIRDEFTFVAYDSLIVDAKSNAARVSYEKGLSLLDHGGKAQARDAYAEFQNVQGLYPGFENVDELSAEALERGINHVLILFENRSDNVIPGAVFRELASLPTRPLDSRWSRYTTQDDGEREFDRVVVVSLADVEFTPERVEVSTYTVKRTIQKVGDSGTNTGTSGSGTSGGASGGTGGPRPNGTTSGSGASTSSTTTSTTAASGATAATTTTSAPTTTTASTTTTAPAATKAVSDTVTYMAEAELSKTRYMKAARSKAHFELRDGPTGELIHRTEMVIESFFEDSSLVMRGNTEALSEKDKALLKYRPRPFPSNETMLTDAMGIVKTRLQGYLQSQRRRIEEIR